MRHISTSFASESSARPRRCVLVEERANGRLVDLARASFRQGIQKQEFTGQLVTGEARLQLGTQIFRAELCTVARHHGGEARLAPVGMWNTEHGALGDAATLRQRG